MSKEPDIGTGHGRRAERGGRRNDRAAQGLAVRYSVFLWWLCHGCLRSLIVNLVYRGISVCKCGPLAIVGQRSIICDLPPCVSDYHLEHRLLPLCFLFACQQIFPLECSLQIISSTLSLPAFNLYARFLFSFCFLNKITLNVVYIQALTGCYKASKGVNGF